MWNVLFRQSQDLKLNAFEKREDFEVESTTSAQNLKKYYYAILKPLTWRICSRFIATRSVDLESMFDHTPSDWHPLWIIREQPIFQPFTSLDICHISMCRRRHRRRRRPTLIPHLAWHLPYFVIIVIIIVAVLRSFLTSLSRFLRQSFETWRRRSTLSISSVQQLWPIVVTNQFSHNIVNDL